MRQPLPLAWQSGGPLTPLWSNSWLMFVWYLTEIWHILGPLTPFGFNRRPRYLRTKPLSKTPWLTPLLFKGGRQSFHVSHHRQVVDHKTDLQKKENLRSNQGSSPRNFPTSDAWALTRPAAWPRSPNFETSVAPWAPYLCINIAADLERYHMAEKSIQMSIDNVVHPPVQSGHAASGPVVSLLHLLFWDDPLNTSPSGHCFLRNSS